MIAWHGRRVCALATLALLGVCSCAEDESPAPRGLVNIQVTGVENLRPMMDELNRRGLTATVWLSAAELNANCTYAGELALRGHEIAGKYPGEIVAETTEAALRSEITGLIEAARRCTGRSIAGFRATRFTSNEATHRLLDELSVSYMMRSNRQVLLSIDTAWPYRLMGSRFAVLPMPLAVYYGSVSSLCDTATEEDLTPQELLLHQRAAISRAIGLGQPVLLEWHPELTRPDEPRGWWGNFTGALDYIVSRRSELRVIRAEDIVAEHPPAVDMVIKEITAARAAGPDCG